MRSLSLSLLCVVILTACGDKPMATAGETSETSAGSESATSTTGPAGSTSTTSTSTGSGTADPTTSGGAFIVEPDGGVNSQCRPQDQDCPEGQKCTAVSDTPGDPWGVNVCVEVMGSGEVGDPCDVMDGKYTGNDDCKKGTICLLTDDAGLDGICVEFCDASDKCPQTPTATCTVYNDGSLPICLPTCDPLLQDCPEGQGCYNSAGDSFVCFKESAMPGEGMPGSECQYINQCQKGSFCANAMVVTGCSPNANGCCTPYCAVSQGNAPCQMGEECVPFFEMGMAPPAYEDVGVCAIPA